MLQMISAHGESETVQKRWPLFINAVHQWSAALVATTKVSPS